MTPCMIENLLDNFISVLSGSDWREMGGSPQTSRELDTVVLQVFTFFVTSLLQNCSDFP